jgi:hypothetical protein
MQDPAPRIKSAFTPMLPQINTELADRLLAQAEARRVAGANNVSAPAPVAQPTKTEPSKKAVVQRVQPVPMEPFTVNLELEIVDDPEKSAPCWGYIRYGVLGVALNAAFEPTKSAIATRDMSVLRWLAMLALVTRLICQHRREPRMKDITKHLWRLVERPTDTFWDSPGVALRLARHPISSGLEKVDLDATGPQTFGSFVVTSETKTLT